MFKKLLSERLGRVMRLKMKGLRQIWVIQRNKYGRWENENCIMDALVASPYMVTGQRITQTMRRLLGIE